MKSTLLTKKLMVAFTGLFLSFFLIIHLFGNLQLFLPEELARKQFNWYSNLLTKNILIKLISWVLYLSIICHILYTLFITVKNKKANGEKYYYDRRNVSSSFSSRNMGVLGTIILLFLIIHFKDFWYVYKFTTLPVDAYGNKDLYEIVVNTYANIWYVIIYEIALLALGFHLLHGYFSSFRTLGLYHPKYVKAIKITGWIYTLIITVGFMAIPLYIHFKQLQQ